MILWLQELRLLLRAPMASGSLALLALLNTFALVSGSALMERQRTAISQIASLQEQDIAALAKAHGDSTDAGSAAYYSFHPAWNDPSSLAFAAVGTRDVAPFILRVRALGLEAQIHDSDIYNPELVQAGRLDFTFVLVFIAPLFLLMLLHDLRSNDEESGRTPLLRSFGTSVLVLYARRAALRYLAVLACIGVPFVVAAMLNGVPVLQQIQVLALAGGYLLFWTVLASLLALGMRQSVRSGVVLVSLWAGLTLVAPGLAYIAVERSIPVVQGAEIAQAQREEVNRAWDIPREDTMARFYARYPEWSHSAPLPTQFHYKWYLAFHQNGDDAVDQMSRRYQAGLLHRSRAAEQVGWLLPPVLVQTWMEAWARTDMYAHLAWLGEVRGFHARLRDYYYQFLFNDRPFAARDYTSAPAFPKEGVEQPDG